MRSMLKAGSPTGFDRAHLGVAPVADALEKPPSMPQGGLQPPNARQFLQSNAVPGQA